MKRSFPGSSFAALAALALVGCGGSASSGPDARETTAYTGIASGEAITLSGTEPFWNAQIESGTMRYSTMEDQEGTTFPVERFAGNNGLAFSGRTPGENASGISVDVAVTPGECSDGMSDRSYPFVATLVVGSETRRGCAYTDRQPFVGPDRP
ncbi:MAG: hypothetical protein MK010_03305 [Erythrobacter sp.]|nr:hypothetical protein [Erythrobacter sp.]